METMEIIVIGAILLSFIIYLGIGYKVSKNTKKLGDFFPLADGDNYNSKVKTTSEFSASTTATSISLVTVIMFFFSMSAEFGPYLFWCVLTTVVGLVLVRLLISKMHKKTEKYENKPSIHEFIGREFGDKKIIISGAIITSLSYLATYAVEVYIGSFFLSTIISIPFWLIVLMLTLVGFLYTITGFRTVIKTDVIQMYSIYLFGVALLCLFIYHISTNSLDIRTIEEILPQSVTSFEYRDGLGIFLMALLVINLCMFLVSMSLFQRVSACKKEDIKFIKKGINRSIFNISISWSIFIAASILVYIFIPNKTSSENVLQTFLTYMGTEYGVLGKVFLFFAVLGLFGALLSTASTNLIAVSQSIYDDMLNQFRVIDFKEKVESKGELVSSRRILVFSAIASMIIVAILDYFGFNVEELALTVYGSQLSLFPPMFAAIMLKGDFLKRSNSLLVSVGIIAGMVFCWLIAVYGKYIGDGNVVLVAPIASLVISLIFTFLSFLIVRKNERN